MANHDRALCHNPGVFTIGLSEVLILQKRAGSKSNVGRDGVGCQHTVSMGDIDHAFSVSVVLQDMAELVDVDFDLRLKLVDRTQSKEILVDADAATVNIVIFRSKRDLSNA